ncbi:MULTISPECIES: envelope stress response membrane protein PspC [Cedecea]|jgi:phage shock protein C|uniref:Transcriptional regulator n=1 Tax=Cedecea neteri TaxID=158822 RepID=A0A089PW14_9ENTR|nr:MULTISPECIES: envelope stress response membrane protein PspC [Cedecea]AIR03116.1 transcriptional regulator [Cedecea neteri]NWC65701.1 envelope stress response membrane protein PspC [Cedecea sp. P7760]
MVNSFSGRKLWRIPEKGMVKGVCAGIAQYLDVPVKLVRAIAILSIFFGLSFFVLVAYIVMTFVLDPMPQGADEKNAQPTSRDLLNEVDAELAAGEQRLRSMERYITSDTFTLRSRFRQL